MQLNIYLISHPLIQNLSNQIINATYGQKQHILNNLYNEQIGQLMTYEAIRKWSETQTMYIKFLYRVKEIHMFHPKESYTIIADLINSHELLNKIAILLPKSDIIHSNLEAKHISENNYDNIKKNTIDNQKIIIVVKFLNNYSIINLLEYLILKKHVKLNQIRIICITCNNQILDKLGKHYTNLNIYTTKIITI